jgi:hypothetical protein
VRGRGPERGSRFSAGWGSSQGGHSCAGARRRLPPVAPAAPGASPGPQFSPLSLGANAVNAARWGVILLAAAGAPNTPILLTLADMAIFAGMGCNCGREDVQCRLVCMQRVCARCGGQVSSARGGASAARRVWGVRAWAATVSRPSLRQVTAPRSAASLPHCLRRSRAAASTLRPPSALCPASATCRSSP